MHERQPREHLGPTLHERQQRERLGPTLHGGHPQEASRDPQEASTNKRVDVQEGPTSVA